MQITYANLFEIMIQTDGLVRFEFKADDPTKRTLPLTAAIIYMKRGDAEALAKVLTTHLYDTPQPQK